MYIDLEEIDSSRVYVLGGIVDLTINKVWLNIIMPA